MQFVQFCLVKAGGRQESDGEQHLRVNFFCPGQALNEEWLAVVQLLKLCKHQALRIELVAIVWPIVANNRDSGLVEKRDYIS